MRGLPARIVLAALGVLMLSGGVVRQEAGRGGQRMTALEHQVWLDSVSTLWPSGIIPCSRDNESGERLLASVPNQAYSRVASAECVPELALQVTSFYLGHHFDATTRKTQLFTGSGSENDYRVTVFGIDSALSWTSELTTADSGAVWLAEDLDNDGNVELVMQYADQLKIRSAPDWRLRARFVFPGWNVAMHPTAFNIDADPYLELYVPAHSLGDAGAPTIIKYQESTDTFEVVSQIWMPIGVEGQSAVGDFDEDGRVEFISGNNYGGGYEVFEWQDTMLVYVGSLVDTLFECLYAAACRPLPGGELHVLVSGDFGDDPGSRYFLYEPTGDNAFSLVRVFEDHTYFAGSKPCLAADVDCDGLDEFVMGFRPFYEVWEWDLELSDFIPACAWDDAIYGTMSRWYTLDLDLNGTAELASTNHLAMFRQFPESGCEHCESDGHCPASDPCACACFTNPECDEVSNVLDVVQAVNVAFRDIPVTPDPFRQCPNTPPDVDCSGETDVLDIVHLVNVVFRSADPATEFCDPCP